MDLLDLLVDHDHWATRTLLDVCAGLSDAQWDRAFDVGHRTLRETFGHMVFNVPFWTAFLAGEAAEGGWSADEQPADRSLGALREHHERGYASFAAAARRVRDEGRLGEVFADHYGVRSRSAARS